MACFQSLLARRLLLWYILLVSLVVLALSWDVTTGCRMILVGPINENRGDLTGFGLFHTAVYDDKGSFLGCVNYSQQLFEYTDDRGFKIARTFAIFLAISTTLAAVLTVFIQCFSKSGKTCLWKVMGWSYGSALAFQGSVFSVWSSNICEEFNGEESKCTIGPDGIRAIANGVLLFGMVIACYNSLPPRNPVFRLWNVIPTEYETDKFDTDDDKSDQSAANFDLENPRSSSRNKDISDVDQDAVSLFSIQKSKHSVRSASSPRSGKSSSSDEKSSGRRSAHESILSGSTNGKKASRSKKNPTTEGSSTSKKNSTSRFLDKVQEDDESGTAGSQRGSLSGSLKDSISGSMKGSVASRSKQVSVHDPNEKDAGSIKSLRSNTTARSGAEEKDPTNNSTKESSREKLLKGDALADYVTTVSSNSTRDEHTAKSSKKGSTRDGSTRKDGVSVKSSTTKSTAKSTAKLESAKFLQRLRSSTVLKEGGIRTRETALGQKLEIVDEYPATNINGVHPPHDFDGTDIVKVRTEYYPEGRKTIKEELHHDGSRTISTLIEPLITDEEIEVGPDGEVQ